MAARESGGFDVDRPPGVLSSGRFRITLLVAVIGLLLIGSLAFLSKWRAASEVMVLKPAPAELFRSPTLQAPTPVALSSPAIPEAEAPGVPRSRDLAARPPASDSPAGEEPKADEKEGEDRFRIQVGAFADSHHAERLESQLRAARFPVYRSTVPRTLTLYEVRVTPNGRANDLAKRLRDLGLSLGTVPEQDGTLLVAPPLPMKRATDLAERLKADGVDVELRRINRKAVVHVVRVGEYPSAAAAAEAQADLKERGYEGVIVKE